MADKKALVGRQESGNIIPEVFQEGDKFQTPDGKHIVSGSEGALGWVNPGTHDDFLDPIRKTSPSLGHWRENFHGEEGNKYEILQDPDSGLQMTAQGWGPESKVYSWKYGFTSRSNSGIWTHVPGEYDIEVTLEPKKSKAVFQDLSGTPGTPLLLGEAVRSQSFPAKTGKIAAVDGPGANITVELDTGVTPFTAGETVEAVADVNRNLQNVNLVQPFGQLYAYGPTYGGEWWSFLSHVFFDRSPILAGPRLGQRQYLNNMADTSSNVVTGKTFQYISGTAWTANEFNPGDIIENTAQTKTAVVNDKFGAPSNLLLYLSVPAGNPANYFVNGETLQKVSTPTDQLTNITVNQTQEPDFTKRLVPGDFIAVRDNFRLNGGWFRKDVRIREITDDTTLLLDSTYPSVTDQQMGFGQVIDLYMIQCRVHTYNTDPPRIEKIGFNFYIRNNDYWSGSTQRVDIDEFDYGDFAIPGSPTSIRLRMKKYRDYRYNPGGDTYRYVDRIAFGWHNGVQWKHLHSFYMQGLDHSDFEESWLSRLPNPRPGMRELPSIEIGTEREAVLNSQLVVKDFKWAGDQEWAELDALPLPIV